MDLIKFKVNIENRYKDRWLNKLTYVDDLKDYEVLNILEDALYYQFVSNIIKQYIIQAKNNADNYRTHVNRKLIKIIVELEKYSEYKFLVIGGAMLENKTIYEISNKKAWSNINYFVENKRAGAVLSVIAYELNGVSTNSIETLQKMFLESTDKISVVKMSKFLDFEPIDHCGICRKKKLKSIAK